jgi:hypothetical protein
LAPTIHYAVTAPASRTIESYVWDRTALSGCRMRFLYYEDLPRLRRLREGTYVFSDLERLGPAELELARSTWCQLRDSGARVRLINEPGAVLLRYELLEALHEAGINRYRAVRASDSTRGLRFPVFIKPEHEHRGSLTPLLHDGAALEGALKSLDREGARRDELIVVEYCHAAGADGIYRKYSAFRVGDRILPRHVLFGRDWMQRKPDLRGGRLDAEHWRFLEDNPHADALLPIFELARIEYGRIDYGVVDGGIQVWEINTNPTVKRTAERLSEAFEALACDASATGAIPLRLDPRARAAARREGSLRRRRELREAWADGLRRRKLRGPLRRMRRALRRS